MGPLGGHPGALGTSALTGSKERSPLVKHYPAAGGERRAALELPGAIATVYQAGTVLASSSLLCLSPPLFSFPPAGDRLLGVVEKLGALEREPEAGGCHSNQRSGRKQSPGLGRSS